MAWSAWISAGSAHINSFGTYSRFYLDTSYRYNRSGNTVSYEIYMQVRYYNTSGGGSGSYNYPIGVSLLYGGSQEGYYQVSGGGTWSHNAVVGSYTFSRSITDTTGTGSISFASAANNMSKWSFDNPGWYYYSGTIPPMETYTISYAANGGTSTPSAQTKTYGTNLTIAAAISKTSTTANGYTVTFNANGGSVSPTSKTATDTTSYSFAGWKSSATGTTWAAGATNFSENNATTLTAQWTSSTSKGSVATPSATKSNGTSTRTVTFNANGGSTTKSSQNSTATITYTSNGWYTATSGGTKRCNNGASYTPSAAETVYAQWGSSTGTFSAVTLPTAAQCTKTNYDLLGWAASSTATTATWSPGASYTPDATKTIYAVWKAKAPSAATISVSDRVRDKISVSVGYTGVELTNYTVYYRANSTGNYSSLSLGTSSTGTITSLQPNTSYQLYVKATNPGGSKDSSTTTTTTRAYLPNASTPTSSSITESSGTIGVSATGDTNAGITNYTLYWAPKPNLGKDLYDMPIKVTSDNVIWARIFYQNVKEGATLFSSVSEAKNTQTADKYSRLNLLDSGTTYKTGDKYEFMLCYPNESGTAYNRWKQTNAPQNEFVTTTSAGDGTAAGYEAVHIDWTSDHWGGMTRQNSDTASISSCYLSGSVGHSNWFYALASSAVWNRGIPSMNSGSTFGGVELWIRVGTLASAPSSKNMGTSTSTSITGLNENTDYLIWATATNAGGTVSSPSLTMHTQSGQATAWVKINGTWTKGKVWYKNSSGTWVQAKKVYVKVNGNWVENITTS